MAKRGRHPITPDERKKRRYLGMIRQGVPNNLAAQVTGISEDTWLRLRNRDATFAAEREAAMAEKRSLTQPPPQTADLQDDEHTDE